MAQSAGMSTIAFPTLGCGNFGYRARDVVDCFQRAASAVGGLQVTVVAYFTSVFLYVTSVIDRTHAAEPFQFNQLISLQSQISLRPHDHV